MSGIDWDRIASGRCYQSPKSLLVDLYYNRGNSILELSKMLEVSYQSITNKMDEFNLPRRERGGANNTANGEGLQCPHCGDGHSKIESTCILKGNHYQRYRLCLKCQKLFRTTETVEEKST